MEGADPLGQPWINIQDPISQTTQGTPYSVFYLPVTRSCLLLADLTWDRGLYLSPRDQPHDKWPFLSILQEWHMPEHCPGSPSMPLAPRSHQTDKAFKFSFTQTIHQVLPPPLSSWEREVLITPP